MATSGGQRDLESLRSGFDAWFRETRGRRLAALERPRSGLSNETLIVTLDDDERLVVRLAAIEPSFPDTDLARQASLINLLHDAGIPTPAPAAAVADSRWIDTGFLVMPFVAGHIPSATSVFDPWLIDVAPSLARTVGDSMADMLGALHRLDPLALAVVARDGRDLAAEVTWWRDYLDWACDGAPPRRLAALLDHCAATCPTATAAPSLCWGDARFENLVFGDDRHIAAVLDWELASIGTAEADLGWHLGLEAVLRELSGGRRVPGFRDDDGFVARYEATLGRRVEHLEWHRRFAVVRSICINTRQATIAARTGVEYVLPADDTNPLLGVVEGWIAAD